MTVDEVINRIGFFRNQQKISGRKLSEILDKNVSYINQLESKKFGIMLYVVLEIIDALGITCEEFFADNYATYKRDKELFDFISSLKSDSKDTLFDLARKLK